MPSPACQAHSPPCSLLLVTVLALSGASAQSSGQERRVLQPEGPMLVAEGDTLLLRCTVMGPCLRDTMKWVQVRGPQQQQQEIYSFRQGVFPGVMPLVPQTPGSSDCDFSILIHNVTKAHAGIYHCTGLDGPSESTEGGLDEGTAVQVWAKPSSLEEAELVDHHVTRPSGSGLLAALITVFVLKVASVAAVLLALAVYRKRPRRGGLTSLGPAELRPS